MSLDKLGNPKLQQQGSESRSQTDDQTTHQLLCRMEKELRAMRVILASMADLDIELRDIGDDYDN